ncbi:YrhK family protein [Salinisphaera sp. Q1T1-3]|uniref:YrhK family protein n=1 Tax=Salinisphaera sp. Q1T1-3 TaxID=2321229 RepID=UPI000E7737BE|nr:YrhK family protein [Salinisphaera sp. Q1T1-3]RJS92390.1 hypothetical protein D3260_12165 [Salinisphaera sp. Q1T1-3]
MPHLFTNRPRVPSREPDTETLDLSWLWETRNALLYELGGVLFIVGSALFLPRFEAWQDIGAWLFFVGSLVYLVVLIDDLLETSHFWPKPRPISISRLLEVAALWCYIVGTLLFTAGSLFFLSWWGWRTTGAWTFVIGSALFVVGACLNVLMIIRASSVITLQLMNLIAVMFIAGSLLFLVASVPYLWQFEAEADRQVVHGFLAWQYLAGSGLFLIGGLLNHYRSHLVLNHRRQAIARDPKADERLMSFLRGEIDEYEFEHQQRGPRP